jgi:hypothetical protein
MRDWPGRAAAERLRQWPTLAYVAERVAEATALEALLIIGSFCEGKR